jgi:hypothetical protein
MYLGISILLILLFSFFSVWKKIEPLKVNYPDFFNFIITLVATFVGVFLAIDFTNKTELTKEKTNVIKLLDACGYEFDIKNNRTYTTLLILKANLDSTNTIKEHLKNNPIQISNLFQTLIVNDVVLRHISTKGIQELSNCADNILRLQASINEGKAKKEKFILPQIELLLRNNTAAQEMLAVEVKILEGEIKDEQIEQSYSYIAKKLIDTTQNIQIESKIQ